MKHTLLVLCLLASAVAASPLFDDNAIIDMELRGPWRTLIRNKLHSDELEFVITVDNHAVPVKVRARGNSRLTACKFPPISLNFSSRVTAGSMFELQDKLKLVTHCNDRTRDAGIVFDEFLAYRIFNTISPYSYRARLIRMRYTDTEAPAEDPAPYKYAIQIEAGDELANRISGIAFHAAGVAYSRLDDGQATLVYVFQYLIGNTDWSLVTALSSEFCCHNGSLFDVSGKIVFVPYDFDLSGLVDASYARPDPSLKTDSVRRRVYRGYCTSPDMLQLSLQTVVGLKPEILSLAKGVPSNSAKDMSARLGYLEQFFDKADDENRLLKIFARQCI
jgi:hypothetical protein